ncbi:MAG: GyrI-like domain-containing protein [Thaumarchaeota archaeon]|nr:GyrI-like domain-containing protein [Nitrososphaerota archaeon]
MAEPEVKFTVAPRLVVASLERKGSYSEILESMKQLKDFIDSKGIEQSGYPFCLYYDNHTETAEEDLKSEACIPVRGPFEPEGMYRLKEFPETEVAETRHTGPPEEFSRTYGPFLEGLINGGFRIVGPAREYYMTVSDVRGPGAGFLIQQPITRK